MLVAARNRKSAADPVFILIVDCRVLLYCSTVEGRLVDDRTVPVALGLSNFLWGSYYYPIDDTGGVFSTVSYDNRREAVKNERPSKNPLILRLMSSTPTRKKTKLAATSLKHIT